MSIYVCVCCEGDNEDCSSIFYRNLLFDSLKKINDLEKEIQDLKIRYIDDVENN